MGAFGERLKREREKRKISLDEVAQATKISGRYLRAIEEEKFDQLPGGVFSKGFIKAYARHLGLNEDQALADYQEAFRACHPEEVAPADPEAEGRKIMEQRARRMEHERPRFARLPWGKAAVALLLFGLLLAVWGSYSRLAKPAENQAASPQKAPKPTVPQPHVPAALPKAAAMQADSSSAAASPAAPQPEAAAAATFLVAIHAREESWIHIQVDGKDLPEDTLQAESKKTIQASTQLVIKAGNIGALDFWFNGQKLPVQGAVDQVKTVTFDSAGLVVPATKAQTVAATVER